MSRLPTLLVPGSLRRADGTPVPPPPGGPEAPVAAIVAWIRRRLPEFGGQRAGLADRVLVVQAETGSGKSTVLPVAVFRIFRAKETHAAVRFRGAGVICTQPRVITAVAMAKDVSAERQLGGPGGGRTRLNPDMVLGATVGYKTGPLTDSPPTGLIYATAGVLGVQMGTMDDGEVMERYRVIIVDEAHERSVDADALLMLLRAFFLRNAGNPRLPFLILASATIRPERYAAYFGVDPEANVFRVAGRAYPVAVHWPPRGTNDFPAEAAAAVLRIHEAGAEDPPGRGDVLVFVPGAREISAVAEAIRRGFAAGGAGANEAPLLVLEVSRDAVVAEAEDVRLVFAPPEALPPAPDRRGAPRPPQRRVVVSTVVAETGLTIDTLRYVVDCGWHRTVEAYQPSGVQGLVTRPAPKSRVRQRMGRAGRVFPGDFFPLYTESTHAALDDDQLPEIITRGFAEIFLFAVAAQQRQKLRQGARPAFRLADLGLLDPPPPEAFLAAAATATALGFFAVDAPLPRAWPFPGTPGGAPAAEARPGEAPPERGPGLTPLGFLAAGFDQSTPMEGIRALLGGYAWGVAAQDLLTAVAAFGEKPNFLYAKPPRPGSGSGGGRPPPPPGTALRGALPPFLAARAQGGAAGGGASAGAGAGAGAPPPGELFLLRARLLLADDFAEAVLLYDAFAARLGAPAPPAGDPGGLAAAAAWCEEEGLDLEALRKLAERRDALASEMVAAGLDPWRLDRRRLGALPAAEFPEGLARFKRCLYDGLRLRLLRLEEGGPAGPPHYLTAQGDRLRAPAHLVDAVAARLRALDPGAPPHPRPRWLLTDTVRLAPLPQRPEEAAPPLAYSLAPGLVSVLDGFVDPDFDLVAPRGPGEL